jgi:Carbohydrate binding module (family 6)/Glycosyl hydrolase family 67 N-terminus
MKRLLLAFVSFFSLLFATAQPAINIGKKATEMELYAAKELQRYIFQLSGQVLPISNNSIKEGFVIGTANSNEFIVKQLGKEKIVTLGSEGYALQLNTNKIFIGADTEVGCMYGVYGLLEDYYGIGFYLGHDAIPEKKSFYLPEVNEIKKPSMRIRGFLPWTNFPQSATVYSWDDWKFIIDQAAKMRMNFIHIHNYNGELGHNEMFHNFTVNGHTSRVWMPTARSGHKWNCPGFDIAKFRFGGEDLFDDYDFGSDCAVHNETLSNEQVFAKGVSLFQRVIAYAHSRGVKMALGLDINLILPEYNTTADDPKVIEARMQQVLRDYPDLDYLILFISELINNKPDQLAIWKKTFDGMYAYMKDHYAAGKIAVAGWGLSKEIAASLPPDVIAAPISHYSDGFEDGSIYGNREYWGCPWMERDFSSSEYYYPFNMHLSNTIKAWQAKAKNMTGLYTLTWRLTDAIDPKMTFIAKAPWDDKGKYKTAYDVYYDYALKNYGAGAAPVLTDIINENEPVSCNDAECQPTGKFTGKSPEQSGYLLNMRQFGFKSKTQTQLYIGNRYTSISGAAIEKREDADSCIAWVEDSAWVRFAKIPFSSDLDSFVYYTATANPYAHIQAHIDSVKGRMIAFTKVPETGGWHNWRPFTTAMQPVSGVHDVYILFRGIGNSAEETNKALKQLTTVDEIIAATKNKTYKRNIQHLRARLEASYQHTQINLHFPAIAKASELPQLFPGWVKNFTHRVTDISSLGNVQSIQNRYVQERYLVKENELLSKAAVRFPTNVTAKGTKTGAVIYWSNNEPNCKGFHIYADGKKINSKLLSSSDSSFTHGANGFIKYHVTVVSADGTESELSPSVQCYTGNADTEAPRIVIVSPPSSVKQGTKFSLKVRLLDNREHSLLNATLYYRTIGARQWKILPMQRKVKAIFTADVLCKEALPFEYYVSATDGTNTAVYPAQSGNTLTVVVEPAVKTISLAPVTVKVAGKKITWPSVKLPEFSYIKVYRSKHKNAVPSSATFLTFLPATAVSFEDNGLGFDAKPLKGVYYYHVSITSLDGFESPPSPAVQIKY